MTQQPMTERDLDELFAAARAAAPPPLPPDLAARIVAAAAAGRAAPAPPMAPARAPGLRARLAALLAELGGAPALGGLATAGIAGLWVGLADPAGAAGFVLEAAAGLGPAVADLFDPVSPFDLLPPDL